MMYALKVACWALIFIFKLLFPPGISIATIQYQYLFYILYNTMQSDSGYDNSCENVHFMYPLPPHVRGVAKSFLRHILSSCQLISQYFIKRLLTKREVCTAKYRTKAFQFIIWLN